MEESQKAINLFSFIKGLNEIKKETITDIDKQIWKLEINKLPKDDQYIQVFSRDRVSEDSVDSDMTILKIKKPEMEPCPKPDSILDGWLSNDYDDFNKEVTHLKEKKNILSANQNSIILFDDSRKRVEKYDEWAKQRKIWVEKQIELNKIRKLFNAIVFQHYELEMNEETEEMIIANGFLLDSQNNDINHPILSRRVKTEFDVENNIISIIDTDNTSELYVSLLRGMNDINHELLGKLNNMLVDCDLHPLDNIDTPKFLKKVIHSMSTESTFSDEGIPDSWKRNARFLLYMNPVFITRKKLDGSIKAIESIIENIQETGFVPKHLIDIISGGKVDIPEELTDETIEQKLAAAGGEDTTIFLSKEANREQLEIAQRIDKYNAVLVQGPPGTGKTHTIANLLGHFLAQGKSVLITSHTSKALNVLKEKIDSGIRDLCVSVLDESNHDMEKSIDGIVEHMTFGSSKYKKQMESYGETRKEIIKELAKTRQAIYSLINQECNTIVINGKEISPSDAAKFVNENQNLDYIPGEIRKNSLLPLSFEELTELYRTNETVSTHEEFELDCMIPDSKELISPTEFTHYWEKKRFITRNIEIIEKETGWKIELSTTNDTVSFIMPTGRYDVSGVTLEKIKEFNNVFSTYKNYEPWLLSAAFDGAKGDVYKKRWLLLSKQIQDTVELSEKVITKSFGHTIDNHGFEYSSSGIEALQKIKDKLSNGGKLGKLDRMFNKTIDLALNEIRIDGKEISSAEDVELIICVHDLEEQRKKCANYWDDLIKKNGGVAFSQLDSTEPEHVAIRWSKLYEKYLEWSASDYIKLLNFLKDIGIHEKSFFGITSFDSENVQLKKQLHVINYVIPKMLDCIKENMDANEVNISLNNQLAILQKGDRVKSDICISLFDVTKNGDDEKYIKLYGDASELFDKYNILRIRRELLEKLDPVAHEWADAIRNREGIHGEAIVPSTIEKAWMVKQYSEIISDILKEPYDNLQKTSAKLSKQYRKVTAQYAENSAWYHLLRRTEADTGMRQSLVGWKQTVKKIGKGTGKNAPMLKAEAKKMMAECQRAVPAWIMTVNKALDSLDPKQNRFDIIIIDEASQSDLSSMAILYMADKIIVVGDDKQVSPMAIGVQNDQIRNLTNEYLKNTMHISHLFDAKTSIYDIAATTFQPLMLTEHFRCVPEIINYSNMLSYDWKIKPLREASSSKLLPATVNYRVNGYSEHKVNKAEVETIVALIKSCIEQPEYNHKTFGVITLVGEVQAKIIQNRLFEELGAKEFQNRKILCGNSANFQGDERDVIFLSMVDSNADDGPLRMKSDGTDDANKKRYNVAVSRARDQIWLVNSLDSANDLKSDDLRKGLIDYFKNPKAFENQREEIVAKADSPFEVEVVSYLVNRGYHVTQQWLVGSYRLDMVVQYNNKKVAIECDGEKYHGPDMVAADMERQTILERIGWKFIRLRGSEYYNNKEAAMNRVIADLYALGIEPEDSELKIEESRETNLLTRVKISAQEKLKDFEWIEPEIETIADALNDNRKVDKAIVEQNEEKIIQKESEKDKLENQKSIKNVNPKEEKVNQVNKNLIEQDCVDKTFTEKLIDKGFEVIDSRSTSNLIWIIGKKQDEESIRDCLNGLNYKSLNFEKRGALKTGGKSAWLVSFNGGHYGKR